ncbi:MAG: WD_0736 family protein [Wolbachia sp.]
MVSSKEKHQIAFCASIVTSLVLISLIATAIAVSTVPAIVACLIIGGPLIVLSGAQAMESYSFLQNSKKVGNRVKNGIFGEPESDLLIERILEPFFNIFGKDQKAN